MCGPTWRPDSLGRIKHNASLTQVWQHARSRMAAPQLAHSRARASARCCPITLMQVLAFLHASPRPSGCTRSQHKRPVCTSRARDYRKQPLAMHRTGSMNLKRDATPWSCTPVVPRACPRRVQAWPRGGQRHNFPHPLAWRLEEASSSSPSSAPRPRATCVGDTLLNLMGPTPPHASPTPHNPPHSAPPTTHGEPEERPRDKSSPHASASASLTRDGTIIAAACPCRPPPPTYRLVRRHKLYKQR